MKKLTYLCVAVLMMCSCEKTEVQPALEHDPIDLQNPKVGQISCYVEYNAECAQGLYTYTQDTLIVRVTEHDGQLQFMEYLTYHSPSHIDGSFGNPKMYDVHFEADYILIPERQNSELFYFYGNDTIFTNPVHDIDLNQNGCYLYHENGDLFIGEEIGYSENVAFGPVQESGKTVVSCVPTILALDAYIIYEPTSIHVSHTIQNTVNGDKINGWVLIK